MEFGSTFQRSASLSQGWGTALGEGRPSGKAGVVRSSSPSPPCTFICQDQLLALADSLPGPLREGALSWGEEPEALHRRHCEQSHMEDLRDSVQVQGGGMRGNTPGGAVFFLTPH